MPIYDYHCINCNKEYYDIRNTIKNRNKQLCPVCNTPMRVMISRVSLPDTCFIPYHSNAFGQTIHSKSERRRLMKQHNLEEVGGESVDTIINYDKKQRHEAEEKAIKDMVKVEDIAATMKEFNGGSLNE